MELTLLSGHTPYRSVQLKKSQEQSARKDKSHKTSQQSDVSFTYIVRLMATEGGEFLRETEIPAV